VLQRPEEYEKLLPDHYYFVVNRGDIWVGVCQWLARGRKLATALDLGCGNNRFATTLCAAGVDARGMDWMRKEKHTRLLCPERYIEGDVSRLPAEWMRSFDLVTGFHLLEHMPDAEKAERILREMERVSRYLVFCEINLDASPYHTCALSEQTWLEMWERAFPASAGWELVLRARGFHGALGSLCLASRLQPNSQQTGD